LRTDAPNIYRFDVRWLLGGTLTLLFMADAATVYAEYWISPFGWAHSLLFEAMPWELHLFDHVTIICLLLALRKKDGKGPRVKPMRTALLAALGALILWLLYGGATGGIIWQGGWQIYLPLSGIILAFAVAAVFRTPEDFALLGKMVLFAAGYRALMCWGFYFLYIRTLAILPLPEYCTSHDDTVLWVVGMIILALRFLSAKTTGARVNAFLFFVFLGGAVLFNQRRIAWVSLGMGLAMVFWLLPPGRVKRRANQALLAILPFVLIYVAVGWGRSEKIFRPLAGLSTVSTEEDESTKYRNMENLGLITTSKSSSLVMGTGWGHEFIVVSGKTDLSRTKFVQWRYFPHNSVLGLLAFTGVLGFFAYWLPFPTAMYFSARMARLAASPLARQIGIISAAQLVVCANQYYGDMGITYPRSVYMLSLSYAVALRLPILLGLYPGGGSAVAKPAPVQLPPSATPT
jgi:hypothetical protein